MQSLAHRLATAPRSPRPDRPVPVTLVITDLDVGGAERALVALAKGLDRRRWEPSVIALGAEGLLGDELRRAGIEATSLDVDRRRPVRAVARLAGSWRSRPPVLVQSFLFHANIAARLAALRAGSPWVIGGLRVAEKRQEWHLTLDRLTMRLALGSVCVSEGVRQFSMKVGKLPADRLTVIPNGIDSAPFDGARPLDRSSLGVPSGVPIVLFVGRLDAQKGPATLIDATGRAVCDRPDLFLLLAGDGPEGPILRRRVEETPGLADRIRWLGRRDDIPALLKSADLLVLPSLWEGMPNVVLEAMAAGRAVLATDVEGTRDLVLPGRTGWLVPAGNPDVLATALVDAIGDPDRLRRFGRAGRERVEADFAQVRVVEAYDRLWSKVLGYD